MHLYIFEDGRIAQTTSAPTNQDLCLVADGGLQIIRMDRGQFVQVGQPATISSTVLDDHMDAGMEFNKHPHH